MSPPVINFLSMTHESISNLFHFHFTKNISIWVNSTLCKYYGRADSSTDQSVSFFFHQKTFLSVIVSAIGTLLQCDDAEEM